MCTDCFLIIFILFFEHKFRCSQHIGRLFKRHTAVLGCGRKSCLCHSLLPGCDFKIPFHCFHGNIITALCCRKISQKLRKRAQLTFLVFLGRNHILHFHCIFRDRSGLVHTQYIDPGKRLNTLHVMQQYFFLCQTDRTYCKRHTGKQIQPFRDHSDHSRDHGRHTGSKPFALKYKCLNKQNNPDWNDGNADPFDQLVQRTDHLRLFCILHSFCFQCQPGNIRIRPHFVKPCMTLSGYNKTSGHQLIAFSFCDLIRFSGQKRLIDLHFSCTHFGIRTHLISGFEDYDIIYHKVFCIDLTLLSIPYHHCMRCIEHRQIIQYFFRPGLLNDPDQSIQYNYR